MKARIYLADLTHTGLGIATEAFPLNIGLVAAYAKKKIGAEIDIQLFKLPEQLKEAIDRAPPHVLGCSNYSWNENLSMYFLQYARSKNPDVLTIFGGTNYPFEAQNQHRFLMDRPLLDMHIFYEGEQAFVGILKRFLGAENRQGIFGQPLEGVQFLREQKEMVSGPGIPRVKNLDELPSPYLTGLLDAFFPLKLTPLLETARGCPFACNFCNAGDSYYNKVNRFSDEYVEEEWTYVAKMAAKHGIGHMTLADNNFGMLPRDAQTAKLIKKLRDTYGWPRTATVWTGKNSKDRVIEATRLLGESLSISMSVQSLDDAVLGNIARSNIKLDHYREISNELFLQGRPQHAELIVPLPGETFASHRKALQDLVDTNLSNITTHTLTMLYGTPYKDDALFLQKYGYTDIKHRIVPLDFGIYAGEPVMDTEEVAVSSNTFSFEEYLQARLYLLVIDLCYNGDIFQALKRHVVSVGLRRSDWIEKIFESLQQLPSDLQVIFDSFIAETKSELWGSREALVSHYAIPENYEKLVRGDAGGNVLFRHKVWLLSNHADTWIQFVFNITKTLYQERLPLATADESVGLLDELQRFTMCQTNDFFNFENPQLVVRRSFSVDWIRWLKDTRQQELVNFVSKNVDLEFSFDEEQLFIKRDALERYGDHLSGKVKVIQRIGGVHRFLRRTSYAPLRARESETLTL